MIGPGAVLVDEGAARLRVDLGEEAVHRHLHVLGVAVVGFAIREGELHRLHHHVQGPGRVLPERGEVVALEEVQHLEQHRPLAGEAAGRHLVVVEGGPERGRHLDLEPGEVLVAEQAAFLLVEGGDAPRDRALVEGVARGADGLDAALPAWRGPRHPSWS